jgi:hypothetical protein
LHQREEEERHCPLCHGLLMVTEEVRCFECMRCRSLARFQGEELLAMSIPGYEIRLMELERRHAEIIALIDAEGARGAARDMRSLRSLHEERQRVLSEFSFLSYFRQFVERW